MKKNMGNMDKGIRLAIAALIIALYFLNVIPGTLGIILMVVAVVFAATSFISFCPLYTFLGINTEKKK
ncbi:MAG TPA: DUF2892 domain-containing protein [Crocinitomicaceae bacterium]|nr:DUF2892 domain-containing protein [Crocinitomicaceae bacterium]